MATGTVPQLIKTKSETLTANEYGTISPTIATDRILQIRAENATINLVILPIYNAEIKVYSIGGGGTLSPYQGSIGVKYTYI